MMKKYRIKFCYGGRAGGKSYAFADSLLLLGRKKKLLIACLREIQDSIKDSVHKLLSDRIAFYGLNDYKVYEDRIDNLVTGTRFIFKGLREQDSQKIKSLEGVDIAWIEEAQTISKKSWEILEPTIRKDGSEIWISMNRLYENDPLWTAVAANPDKRTWLRRVNYCDNPFCPEEMRYLAEKCRRENPESYEHIWMGAPMSQGNERLIGAAGGGDGLLSRRLRRRLHRLWSGWTLHVSVTTRPLFAFAKAGCARVFNVTASRATWKWPILPPTLLRSTVRSGCSWISAGREPVCMTF